MPSFFPGPVSIPSALGWLFSLALYGNSRVTLLPDAEVFSLTVTIAKADVSFVPPVAATGQE